MQVAVVMEGMWPQAVGRVVVVGEPLRALQTLVAVAAAVTVEILMVLLAVLVS